jgi:UDP-3-O-[3-hydroxymyristoyl] glucosamine N-acyltransferase
VRQELTLEEAARTCGARLEGDPERAVLSTAPLERATARDLTFYDGRQDGALLERTTAAGVLVPEAFQNGYRPANLLRADAPHAAFLAVARELWTRRNAPEPGVAASAAVHPTARLGRDVHVGEHATIRPHAELKPGAVVHPGAVVGDAAVLGERSVLHANAVVGPGARIGADCVIHAGAVIGFAYRPSPPGAPASQAVSVGGVEIEDGVEIGPGSVVEDGEETPTTIAAGARIGGHVMVGHDCVVGAGAHLVAMVGLAGGARIGAEATLFGQVGVAGDATIGERAVIYAKSGVAGDVPPGGRYFGIPARPRGEAAELLAAIDDARDLAARVERLERAGGAG